MRPWRSSRLNDDAGSASLEFLSIGTLFLVPLAYLMLTLAALQSATLTAEAAARHSARLLADDPTSAETSALADAVVAFAADDHDIDPELIDQRVDCSPTGPVCGEAGDLVIVTVEIAVPLPFAAGLTGGASPLSVPVSATASFPVSKFSGSP